MFIVNLKQGFRVVCPQDLRCLNLGSLTLFYECVHLLGYVGVFRVVSHSCIKLNLRIVRPGHLSELIYLSLSLPHVLVPCQNERDHCGYSFYCLRLVLASKRALLLLNLLRCGLYYPGLECSLVCFIWKYHFESIVMTRYGRMSAFSMYCLSEGYIRRRWGCRLDLVLQF